MEFKIFQFKKSINQYFGNVPHRVLIKKEKHNHLFISIEYTDFLSESNVVSTISRMAGERCELYVARECSDKMMKEVLATFTKPPQPLALYKRMAEYEMQH